jgi:outer membrane protein OmpA-like peptidoglycan-associated protein
LNKTLVIEINGFTDNIGADNDNIFLSENRAKAVYDLIATSGIFASRLSYNGYGEQFPKADNDTEKGRANNRRTEFKIIRQ